MDPQATLQRIKEALEEGEREEARHAAVDLVAWLRKGGFRPCFSRDGRRYRLLILEEAPTAERAWMVHGADTETGHIHAAPLLRVHIPRR